VASQGLRSNGARQFPERKVVVRSETRRSPATSNIHNERRVRLPARYCVAGEWDDGIVQHALCTERLHIASYSPRHATLEGGSSKTQQLPGIALSSFRKRRVSRTGTWSTGASKAIRRMRARPAR